MASASVKLYMMLHAQAEEAKDDNMRADLEAMLDHQLSMMSATDKKTVSDMLAAKAVESKRKMVFLHMRATLRAMNLTPCVAGGA